MFPDLDAEATQSGFATLVNCSKQAIQKRCEKGLLKRGESYRKWLSVYIDSLREEAAGRTAGQKDLTAQRIAESEQKTLALQLANLKELGALVPTEDVADAFGRLSRKISGAIEDAGNKILDGFASKYEDVEIEDEFILEPLRAASCSIAKNAQELGEDFMQRVEGADT